AGVLLAMRYLPIGVAVAPELRGNALSRFFQSMLVLDESWSLANRGDGTVDRATLLGAGLALYISWQAGTIIGVFGGGLLGDPESLGLDAAFPALFLALLAPKLNTNRTRAAALLGFSIALVLLPFVRPGVPLVAATLGCLVGWKASPVGQGVERTP
ncbi:MAG: AzlC family ABC transporter permease, partial [Tepidiformaceae bacterium]